MGKGKANQSMIFGVMSDTHGNFELMLEAAVIMTELHSAEFIYHLGDDYRDCVELKRLGYDARGVPGLWCPEYNHHRVPRRLVDTIEGLSLVCVQSQRDLRPVDTERGLVLTGHTHAAIIEHIGRTLFVNPGHLKSASNRCENASFAMIEITDKKVCVEIRELSDAIRTRTTIKRQFLASQAT
jgi:putative phosphoesterase